MEWENRSDATISKKASCSPKTDFRKKKASANRRKAKLKVAKISQDIKNHRDEFLHQVSRKLVDSAGIIVFENININGMSKNHHLAKHILDHAWGKLIQSLRAKLRRLARL
jgi:putative transposase